MDLDQIHRGAVAAAFAGAKVLKEHFGNLTHIGKKGRTDLVTEADTTSERVIVDLLRSRFPDHSILAEEGSRISGSGRGLWIIDPLDGTTNYAHGLSLFAVSIGFAVEDILMAGVVLNPMSGEMFSAVKGHGAQLNGSSIGVSRASKLADSLLVTGFPYNLEPVMGEVTQRFSRCLKAARGIRRLGAAALDLCYVACGRFDGFWEQYLNPWDTAAGVLIANEAGATTTNFSNQAFRLDQKEILSTNGHIHDEMIRLLNAEDDA
jgi:myo-inositol-1(or 4)-monophosphatase